MFGPYHVMFMLSIDDWLEYSANAIPGAGRHHSKGGHSSENRFGVHPSTMDMT